MKLLLSQKNEMYRLIDQHGLGHEAFHCCEHKKSRSRLYTNVSFGSSGNYNFLIVGCGGRMFKTRQSPSENKFREERMHEGWINVLQQFDHWLCCLKHEVTQPDLWAKRRSRSLRNLFSCLVKDAVSRILPAGWL